MSHPSMLDASLPATGRASKRSSYPKPGTSKATSNRHPSTTTACAPSWIAAQPTSLAAIRRRQTQVFGNRGTPEALPNRLLRRLPNFLLGGYSWRYGSAAADEVWDFHGTLPRGWSQPDLRTRA